MLTSPIAMTIGADVFSLKRINQDNFGSVYKDSTSKPGTEVKLTIKNAYEGKSTLSATQLALARTKQYERHIADLEVTVFDVDGFPTVTQTYTHIRNVRGGVATAAVNAAKALADFVDTNATQLVAWES